MEQKLGLNSNNFRCYWTGKNLIVIHFHMFFVAIPQLYGSCHILGYREIRSSICMGGRTTIIWEIFALSKKKGKGLYIKWFKSYR